MSSLRERFEAKVDRSGEHHRWTGSKRRDGAGQLKVNGRTVTAQRVAWELANGPVPDGVEIQACLDDKACVRIEHLSSLGTSIEAGRTRAAPGAGSMTQIRPGVWKVTVTIGHYDNGSIRREYTTIRADNETDAARQKAAFVAELQEGTSPERKEERDVTVDEAVEEYLEDHLRAEMGREERTIRGYRQVHNQWFSPEIGSRRLRDVDLSSIRAILGKMQRAGLSHSRLNNAISLYKPLFRWAVEKRYTRRSPIPERFQLPKSRYVSRQRTPPEVEQVCRQLAAAVKLTPEVASVLTLSATTGMRRGELVVRRRDQFRPARRELVVDSAADVKGIKATKTNTERTVVIDQGTVDMLLRHIEQIDERAASCGVDIAPTAYIFSLEPDCSTPMSADYLTKRVAVLKDHLGIPDKHPETIALEDEALALFRTEPTTRPAGRRGPKPKGGMSYQEIGRRLNRSSRWAALAVASAQRREAALLEHGEVEFFDGSILGLRKFTSSELLDAKFNVSAVAQRQGHGPQVLTKHYAKGRRSADQRAADHLGRLVHQQPRPVHPPEIGPSL
jgi:site-specific recombinase XerD